MPRIAGPLLACALALANAPANAQAGATPAPPEDRDASTAGEPGGGSPQVPTADDICRAGAEGIAQFMPHTASWHGLADPFDPMESLSRDRWDKIDTPRAILASLPPTTVRCARARGMIC